MQTAFLCGRIMQNDPPPDVPATSTPEGQFGWRLARTLKRHFQRHLPEPKPAVAPTLPPPSSPRLQRILGILKVLTFALIPLFAFSFFWDFNGIEVTFGTWTVSGQGLLRAVSISGLIGFLTNWVAITMLFHPRERRPILQQGLVPAQRERIILKLADAVTKELINADLIAHRLHESGVISRYRDKGLVLVQEVLADAEFREEFKRLVEQYAQQVLSSPEVQARLTSFIVTRIEEYASEGVKGWALKFYRSVGETHFQQRVADLVASLPGAVEPALDRADRLLDRLPVHFEEHAERIERQVTEALLYVVRNIDIRGFLVANMRTFDESRLEHLILNTSNEQFTYIKYLGTAFGMLGGLVIWQPFPSLLFLALLGGSVLGLDVLLYRKKQGS